MKRLVSLLFTIVSIGLYAQIDTISMDMLPQATVLNATDKFWILQSGIDKYIEKQDFIHWNSGTGTLYVPDITRRVGIGTITPSADYILSVVGNTLLWGDMDVLGRIAFSNSYIRQVGNNMTFYDAAYGSTITLSELIQTSQSLLAGNATTIDATNHIDLGGALDENTTIVLGSRYLQWTNVTGLNFYRFDRDNLSFTNDWMYLHARNKFDVVTDSVEFGFNTTNGFYVRDKRPYYTGLQYYADYSSRIKLHANRIPSVKTVALMFRDSIGNYFFDADTIETSTGNSVIGGYVTMNDSVFIKNYLRLDTIDEPAVPHIGEIYPDKADSNLYFYNGTSWEILNGGGAGGGPGGTSGQVQFNNSDAFGGFGGWDGQTLTLTDNVITGMDKVIADSIMISSTLGIEKGLINYFHFFSHGIDDAELTVELLDNDVFLKTGTDQETGILLSETGNIITLYSNTNNASWNGAVMKFNTDTAATKAYARSVSGATTPAGANYQFQYYNGGVLGASSNFGFSTNTDTVTLFGYKIYKNATSDLIFNNGTSNMLELDHGGTWVGGVDANAAVIRATASTTAPTFSWDADDNTGIYRSAADNIKIQAGGDDVMHFAKDSVLLPELVPYDTAVLIITPTGKIDTAQLEEVADDEFLKELIPFEDYERYWVENNSLKDMYASKNPYQYITNTVRQVERNFMYDAELRQRVEVLEDRVRELEKQNKFLWTEINRLDERINYVYKHRNKRK